MSIESTQASVPGAFVTLTWKKALWRKVKNYVIMSIESTQASVPGAFVTLTCDMNICYANLIENSLENTPLALTWMLCRLLNVSTCHWLSHGSLRVNRYLSKCHWLSMEHTQTRCPMHLSSSPVQLSHSHYMLKVASVIINVKVIETHVKVVSLP